MKEETFPWTHGDVTKHWDTGRIECLRCHRQAMTMRELADQPCS